MKIGLLSLGCPKNLVDAEVMLGLAQRAGHEITRDASEADVLVVNTCAFIDRAKEESVDAILEMAAHKASGACRRLIVTGCLAERYRDELRREIPEIDVVLGTGDVPAIVGAIENEAVSRAEPATGVVEEGARAVQAADTGPNAVPVALYRRKREGHEGYPAPGVSLQAPAGESSGHPASEKAARATPPVGDKAVRVAARHREAAAVRPLPTYLYDADTPRVLTTPRHFAYVKVAEGCDYNCAFCIIPTLRGQYRSRPVESIVREARRLAGQGVKELLLISQDTTFYGIDRHERGALARLLRALDDVEGLEWIRLLYLYPTTVTDDVLAAMAELPKVCRYVDLPLQHSAAGVLRRMRRPGNRTAYEKLLDRARARVPGVSLRTTFIVGFPGETNDEFQDLCDFVRTVEFDHVGVFTYSHEEGTAAYDRDDDVPPRVKRSRQRRLMEIQRGIVERKQRARVGTTAQVLVDGPSPEHDLVVVGRLEGQAPEIDSVVYLTECDPSAVAPGHLLEVRITEARGYDLVAHPLSGPPRV